VLELVGLGEVTGNVGRLCNMEKGTVAPWVDDASSADAAVGAG
jgi:hypothetical protein